MRDLSGESETGTGFRIETDGLGEVAVPLDALHGPETQRALENFSFSGDTMPARLVRTLLEMKAVAASVNAKLGQLDPDTASAIGAACRELLGDRRFMRHFPVDVFQTGSGTSTHMNVNEVLARLATRTLGRTVDAHDDVNRGQSSNDVMPTAIQASAALAVTRDLLPALRHLGDCITEKGRSLSGAVKLGRTHLMDAMPVRFDQVLSGWAYQVDVDAERIERCRDDLLHVPIGGTAVGTGVNAHPAFAVEFCEAFSRATGLEFRAGASAFALMGGQDAAVAMSGQLRTAAVTLTKIANDLRWMSSGPIGGLDEIELDALQPGSSIMPGKVNPVIPEAVAMVSAQVAGNDLAVALAGQSGNFELNVMLPLIARNLLESVELLAAASNALADKAIRGMRVREHRLRDLASRSPMLATALTPLVGHRAAATIARQSWEQQRPVLDVATELTAVPRAQLERMLDPLQLTQSRDVFAPAGKLLQPSGDPRSDRE